MTLSLTQKQLKKVLAHIRAEAPNEACGLLAGKGDRVTHVLPAQNVAEDPTVEYLMDPQEQLRHFQAIEEHELKLLAIYHSHPASTAYPSPTDLSRALYPEATYVIVSLLQSDDPVLRAFRMVDNEITEVGFEVIPSKGRVDQKSDTTWEVEKRF
jgi:proteasome lid subunit RPN8/RPN11